MNREELLARINSVEWDDIEFKKAHNAVPKGVLEAVSAFANASGGHIVFGVSEAGGGYAVTGVSDVDKVQGDFFSLVENAGKINAALPVTAKVHEFPEGRVICIHIPEAPDNMKPVHLDGDLRRTFIRRGAGNHRCNMVEIADFIRHSGGPSYDSQAVEIDPLTFFDPDSVLWYRKRIPSGKGGTADSDDDATFLRKMGFIVERDGQPFPMRAAVLLFGKQQYVFQQLPSMLVDLKFYRHAEGEYSTSNRWADRVEVEGNLVNSLGTIIEFLEKHTNRPFAVDLTTFRQIDAKASFREAAVNLLIHQDYGREGLPAVIRIFDDCVEFVNPGCALASRESMLEPGAKELRNPHIVAAFRRIRISEQEGFGLPEIFANWRRIGYLPPKINNDKEHRVFRITLPTKLLFEDETQKVLENAGIDQYSDLAVIVAFLLRENEADLTDIKALTGQSSAAALKFADDLVAQGVLKRLEGTSPRFCLGDRLGEIKHTTGSATGSATLHEADRTSTQFDENADGSSEAAANEDPTGSISGSSSMPDGFSEAQWAVIEIADTPCSLVDLMEATGFTHKTNFRRVHLKPLIEEGLLEITDPESPNSPKQRYVLTRDGRKLRHVRFGSATLQSGGSRDK